MKQSTFSAVMANSIKNLLQGYTKGIRFVTIFTILFTIGVGNMWADYTITFKSNTTNTDGNQAQTSIANLISNGSANVSSISASYAYNGKSGYGVKLGSSSNQGYVTMNLANSAQVKASKLVVSAAHFDEGKTLKVTVTYTDNTTTTKTLTPASTITAYDVELTATKTIKIIKIESVTKNKGRMYCSSIKVVAPTWKIKGSWDGWTEHAMTVNGTEATCSLSLSADKRYEFGFDGNSTFYKNNGAILGTTSGWVFNSNINEGNCRIHTGPAGTYTFKINTSTKSVTVTYPDVTHPHPNYVYFKNSDVWGTVYAYLANNGNSNKAADWPGTAIPNTATICDETYHYAALSSCDGLYNLIIFNNGKSGYGNQTSDLSVSESAGKYNANRDANWYNFTTYSITFNSNGGSGTMSTISGICPGDNQTLPSNTYERECYTFQGWATSENGDKVYDNEATIPSINNDINLYAIWKQNTYTITLKDTDEELIYSCGGDALTLPTRNSCDGYTFIGWTNTWSTPQTTGTPTKPTIINPNNYTPNTDVNLYPVYEVTGGGTTSTESIVDVLTRATTGITGTSYSAWSGKTATSSAVYAGQSAGGNDAIQLRSNNNNSGIVTTTSGGKATKVSVEWNSETADGRTLNVYGKNSAYSAATDLYSTSTQGTLLGTIVEGNSTELTITDDYEYIGLRSASGAMYLDEISITWETTTGSESTTSYVSVHNCCTELGTVNNVVINKSDDNIVAEWEATSSGKESNYLVKLYNRDKSSVIGEETISSTNKSYTFASPGAGEYWVSVTPLGTGEYCEEGTETFSTSSVTISGNVTVTFDANGGSLTTTTQLIPYNTATNLTTFANLGGSVPTCKKFKNWNTKSDGSSETYTDGQSVTLTGALKLYAIYEDIEYSVTDGTMTGVKSHSYSSNSITCGATITITCAAADTHKGDPTVTATGTHGEITVVSATEITIENIQSDIEVSISYEPKTTYTITWHVSGTSPSTTTNFIEGTPLEFPTPPNAPNDCAEKEFVGWVDESQKDYYHAENAPTFIQEGTPVNANANYYAVFATPDANGVGSDYKKVTSNLSDWSGEYLIVYETSETAGVAFDGSLADLDNTSNDTKSVEIENESIAATEETNAINFTIGKIENSSNYYIKSASGKYIGRTADSNGMNISSSDKYPHQISFSDPGWSIPVGEIIMLQSVINGSTVGTPMLLYMSGTGSRFRYYDSAQDPIALYRKSSYTDYTTTCVETFNVIYEANGATSGNVPIDENNYILDATVTVLGNTGNLQKTHYSFVEWNTQADGNGTPYQAGETFTITEDVTLYAIWEELPKFTVIWSVDGDPTTEQVYQGYQPTSPPAISTPPCGDVFVGWTDAENGNYEHGTSNLYKTLGNMPTISKETTFYAVFADYVSE